MQGSGQLHPHRQWSQESRRQWLCRHLSAHLSFRKMRRHISEQRDWHRGWNRLPQCPEIRIVAPVARPFMKFRGNLNNVCTESIAARPSFPVNCPTTTASMVTYSCWIRLPAMIGSTNSRIPLLTFPFVSVCFSILFPSLDCGIKIPRACKFLQII